MEPVILPIVERREAGGNAASRSHIAGRMRVGDVTAIGADEASDVLPSPPVTLPVA